MIVQHVSNYIRLIIIDDEALTNNNNESIAVNQQSDLSTSAII